MRRKKQPLQERLDLQAHEDRNKAGTMPAGAERDALLRRAKEMERASSVSGWLNSAELKPPE
jgi:hypothetical protein